MKLLLMADGLVGLQITAWLLGEYPQDLALVIATSENEIASAARNAGVACAIYESAGRLCDLMSDRKVEVDLGLLAWWPRLIKQPLLRKPTLGFINTHPSLLPNNRGKHYNFWALVEQAPFGVSLHMVDEGIDSGDVIAQLPIEYTWEDNGETLYSKALDATVRLFQQSYPAIRSLQFSRIKQNLSAGSFHLAAEIDSASRIDMDKQYLCRDLLNLLRARTFSGRPACWFEEQGATFEVRVQIRRKSQ